MGGVTTEFAIFISACLTGGLVCTAYCVLRVFRRLIRHKMIWISLEDILFWIATAIYVFIQIYKTCSGNIRWYFVIGVLAGGILIGSIMQKIFVKIDEKTVDKIKKTRYY